MDIITALGIPAWVIGLGLALFLILKGTLVLGSDADERTRVATKAATAVAEAEKSQLTIRANELNARLDALIADRNAWRDAHGAEVEARRAAENTAAKLLDTGNLALALLEALKEQVGERRRDDR